MTAVRLPFRSSAGKYNFLGQPKLINAYVEVQGDDTKGQQAILAAPGLTQFASVTDTPCRGLIYLEDLDLIYSVHSSAVYKVTSAGVVTRVGTVPGNDTVQLSRNQNENVQISIHCDAGEFYIQNDLVKQVDDEDLPTAVTQDHASGYTAYGIEDGRFFISSINDCSAIDGTDYATAESSADRLVRVKFDSGYLYLFSQRTIEPWRNTGNADFPFEPTGPAIQKGLVAPHAVVPLDNTLFWPGEDNIIYRLAGNGAQRVSTHEIERLLEADPSRSLVQGFPFTFEGHAFANFIGSNWSKSYDAATQAWHDRVSYGLSTWRARHSVRAWGKTIVGDTLSGKLFYLDKDSFQEDDQPMIWGGDSPVLHTYPNGGIVDAAHFDFATGYGTLSGQGSDPKVMLSISTDGGNTFRADRELSLGQRGNRIRVTARRLGRFGAQGMVFRWRVSDPVVRALVNCDVQVRPLKK